MVFALKDMSFLRDDTKRRLEIKTAKEELDNLNEDMQKLEGRKQIVWEDYTFVVKYEAISGNTHTKAVENARQELAQVIEQLSQVDGSIDIYKEKRQRMPINLRI